MSVQLKGSGTIGGLDEGLVVSGIVTSSTQINVGSNIKLGSAGVVTATSFVGSGAQLTGITSPAITSIDSDAVSRVLTTDGDGTATAHSEVKIETVSGNKRFSINRGTGSTEVPLLVRRTDASGIVAEFSNSSGYGVYIGQNGATGEGYIRTATGQPLVFTTNAGSGIANARLRIGSSGETTLFRLNTFPNPNNTGSEIDGSKLVFGSNIILEERYPNGAYVDRQDLVLRTNSGYGQGMSDKIRFTAGGTINFESSGGGLNFGAMSNVGGMTSETLDDYEEGDHTTSVTMTGDTSFTYVSRVLTYTKIGRVVHVTGRLHMYGCSGSSFSFTLPFTCANGNKFETSNEMQNIRFNDDYTFRIVPNTAVASLQNDGSTVGIGADNIHINVNLTYFT